MAEYDGWAGQMAVVKASGAHRPPEGVAQEFVEMVPTNQREALLEVLRGAQARAHGEGKTMVFCNTTESCAFVHNVLQVWTALPLGGTWAVPLVGGCRPAGRQGARVGGVGGCSQPYSSLLWAMGRTWGVMRAGGACWGWGFGRLVVQAEGIPHSSTHGDLIKDVRVQQLAAFAHGDTDILVCTDICARGLLQSTPIFVCSYPASSRCSAWFCLIAACVSYTRPPMSCPHSFFVMAGV